MNLWKRIKENSEVTKIREKPEEPKIQGRNDQNIWQNQKDLVEQELPKEPVEL